MSEIKDENLEEEYDRLKKSKLKQQKLPAWRPVPTITSTTITFISFGVIFILIGIIILIYSGKIQEYSIRYDDHKECENQSICNIKITIDKKMKQPIMVYYQINKFYQNHRRYVKSKSDDQLNGKDISYEVMKDSQDCDPVITNKDMNKNESVTKIALNEDDVAIPCGLIAKSYFNDVFSNWRIKSKFDDSSEDQPIYVNEKDIAWKADKELKYKNVDLNRQWIDMTDEHFIVWMRPAGLPNFRKLWGRINTDLKAKTEILVHIDNKFDVSSFNGKKYLILSTVNAFGGKNSFLGISYIVLGGISIILAIVFVIGYNIHSKKQK